MLHENPKNLGLSSEQGQLADMRHPDNWHYGKKEDGSRDSANDTLLALNTTPGTIATTDPGGSPISDFSGLGDPEFCLEVAEKDEKAYQEALPSSQRGYNRSSGATLTQPVKVSGTTVPVPTVARVSQTLNHAGKRRINQLLSLYPVRDAKRARTGEEEKVKLVISASTTAFSIQLAGSSEPQVLVPICNDPDPRPSRAEEPWGMLQTPSVLFTLDGRLQSVWPTTVVESMFENFSRYCNVHLNTKQYNVDPVMRYSLPDFNRWYLAETATYASTIRFSIFRKGKLERGYPGCKVDSYFFHLLKQCIWDHFWETSEVEQIPPSFHIVVTPCKDLDLPLSFDSFMPGGD